MKMRRGGLNGVSVYVNWGLHSPKQGVHDFNGVRDWDLFMQIATEVGIFVLFRPGPYINAETAGGGLPTWLGPNIESQARTAAHDFRDAWEIYFGLLNRIVAKHQVRMLPDGRIDGCIIMYQIDNEFSTSLDAEYMEQLKGKVRADGIHVPLFHNDAWNGDHWARGKGAVDIYAWDAYPNLFDPSEPKNWVSIPDPRSAFFNRRQANGLKYVWQLCYRFLKSKRTAPMFIAEFQGGTLDIWGGSGHDKARAFTDYDFVRVFYKNNIAGGVTMQNFYMFYGGTNWGHSGKTLLYTSYDYGGAITEDRRLTDKYYENKLIGYFLEAAANQISATDPYYVSGPLPGSILAAPVAVFGLKNLFTGAEFRVVRHENPCIIGRDHTKEEAETSKVLLQISDEYRCVPATQPGAQPVGVEGTAIIIGPRQSKLLVSFYPFETQFIEYCTTDILTHLSIGTWDCIVLYAEDGEFNEIVLKSEDGKVSARTLITSRTFWHKKEGQAVRLRFRHEQCLPILVEHDGSVISPFNPKINPFASGSTRKPLLVLAVSRQVAYKIWKLEASSTKSRRATFPVLIRGPYIVRSVTIDEQAKEIDIRGDLDSSTPIDVWSHMPPETTVFFNGKVVATTQSPWNSLHGVVRGPPKDIKLPALSKWKTFAEENVHALVTHGTPDMELDFDDSDWIVCTKTETKLRATGFSNPILFADDYGFHMGHINYRGRFMSVTGCETGITLTVDGGDFYIFGLWLNGVFLGTGESRDEAQYFAFPPKTVNCGRNIVYVLVDHMGRDDDWDACAMDYKNYRGIKFAKIDIPDSGEDSEECGELFWKIQGNLGGENLADSWRGVYNVGGLYGERKGWHLPDFPDHAWKDVDFETKIHTVGKGPVWFRTTFALDLSSKLDVPISLKFNVSPDEAKLPFKERRKYRAQFYVNGWLMGRYVHNLGPQIEFPIPEGTILHDAENTVALVVWDLSDPCGDSCAKRAQDFLDVALVAPHGAFVYGGAKIEAVASPAYDAQVYA
ncbi:hypothetical protein HDU84_008191 [Entophlyctis sp. JEL0112]|nr:hypothetical protein HDU84_008191 [Entophlyctis sp. JEL0112]